MLQFLEVGGPDAGEFLHRVTAGTVKGLALGQGRAGMLLNGQSRVLAQFDLLRVEQDRFLLAVPRECTEALMNGLEALHFSENLTMKLLSEEAHAVARPGSARAEPFAASEQEWPSPVPGFLFTRGKGEIPAGFEFARVGALIPWPMKEWGAGGVTPALEAGMLPWIDRHKGCYPGQEVVELSLNVGHPVRVLASFEGRGEVEGATSVSEENGTLRAIARLPWAKKDQVPPGFSRLVSQF
jgi:folate-binding Fe-S cluster repair protein YgfZ